MSDEKRKVFDEPLDLVCEELQSGQQGRLIVRDDEVRLELFEFGRSLEFKEGEGMELNLRLENGSYATLLSSFDSGGARHHGRDFVFLRRNIVPNLVLLGPRCWRSSDLVRSMVFTFVGAETAVVYGDHLQRDSGSVDSERLDVAHAEAGNIRLTLRMSVFETVGGANHNRQSTPVLLVDFENGVEIRDVFRHAHNILTFFEISLGQRSRLLDLVVRQLGELDFVEHIQSRNEVDEFKVRYFHGHWSPPSHPAHKGDAIFRFYDAEVRKISAESLRVWIERANEWGPAYGLASGYLGGKEVYDRDRLLRLMAWFEGIPSHSRGIGLTRGDIDKPVKAARIEAQKQDISVGSERLSQVLGELKRLPLKARLTRAIESNRTRFGQAVVPSGIEDDCHLAAVLRDRAAHGSLSIGQDEFPRLFRAIHAVELICCLSMLADLPIPAEMLTKRRMHKLLGSRLIKATRRERRQGRRRRDSFEPAYRIAWRCA